MKNAAIALLIAHLVSLGCGGGNEPPTRPTPQARTFEAVYSGSMPGHSSACIDFAQGASGPAYAHVGVPVPLEIGSGRCGNNQVRTVITRADTGEVTATLPAGDSFVRVENPGDGRLDYQVLLRSIMVF
jgi:hypothetical protein